MLIYTRSLKPRLDVNFASIGNAVSTDTIRFNINNLVSGRTYQWFVKSSTTQPDIEAIAGDFGTVTDSTLTIDIPLPTASYTVGSAVG